MPELQEGGLTGRFREVLSTFGLVGKTAKNLASMIE